jgi:hypothetical protein
VVGRQRHLAQPVDVAALRAELVTCRVRLDEIAADYEDDKITRTQFLTRTDKRRAKMAAIEAQLAEATEVSPLAPLVGADDVAAWEALTLGQQRAVIGRGRAAGTLVSYSGAGKPSVTNVGVLR